ncbi:MAG: DUF1611 domain-containing protein [Candidatus Eremiobacteraeota bacterium]|nr:DUF1611 domain-containing protein [Candidatus Eremiobacteraeota bacterium]
MKQQASRRYIALTDGYLADAHHAKTAHGVLRYGVDETIAIVDEHYAGRHLGDVVPSIARDVPIVASVHEALAYSPTALLVGVAVSGGALPPTFRTHILAAIDAGLEIVNGLHQFVTEDDEFVTHARASGARLWDVRKPPDGISLFSGEAYAVPQVVVLAVGSDCSVGKMSVMLEIAAAANAAGTRAEFVATGQTGIMIAGKGICVDRVISDFVSGAAEQVVLDVSTQTEFTFVEGQGSIIHPAFAAVTYGLMFGSAPDMLVLCHDVTRKTIGDGEFDVPIPDLKSLAHLYESTLAPLKPAACVAVALNTSALNAAQAQAHILQVQALTGLPADDVVRFGGSKLWQAVRTGAERTPKWLGRRQAARR